MFSKYYPYLPLVNFTISTAALSFQMFILYPWHEQLSKEFIDLKKHVVYKDYVKYPNFYLSKGNGFCIPRILLTPSSKE